MPETMVWVSYVLIALDINILKRNVYILCIQEIYTLQAHMSNRDTDCHCRMELLIP